MTTPAITPARQSATPATHTRANALENIVLMDRTSIILVVVGEDAAYVVGYYADIRGIPVNTELTRFRKDEIALRMQVKEELKPHGDELSFSHRKEDRS